MNAEQLAMFLIISIFSVPAVCFGIVLCCGKGGGLIAGYNTASAAEQSKWNEKALCRGTGVLLLTMVGLLELTILGGVLGADAMVWTGLVLLAVAMAAGLLYINKSKRFKKQ